MNPGGMPGGGGSTPSIGGGSTPSLGGGTPSIGGATGAGGITPSAGGAGGAKGGIDAKSQAIAQADNVLGKYVSNTPDVGEKVGLSKEEAKKEKEEAKEAEENGEPHAEQPSAPTPGEKIGEGKQINENGEVEKTSTRKLLGAAGTAVATYYGGAKGAELASQIDNSKTGNAVLGKVSDVAEKVPGVEQAAKDLEGTSEAVTGAAAAYVAAKNGNYGEAIKQAKQAKKGLSKQHKTIIKKTVIASLPAILFLLIIITVIILPFEGGYLKITDFISDVGEGISDAWGALWGSQDGGDEVAKAIIGDVPGYDSLSQNRKNILLAGALAVGKPYASGGRPTSNTLDGLNNGVDGGGLAEWLIWNLTGVDPGYLSGSAIAHSSDFIEIAQSELKPGDFGVNGSDVGMYYGNDQWLHVDPSAGVIKGSYNGYTKFYRHKSLDGNSGGAVDPGSTTPATGKLKDVFPDGIPTTPEGRQKYLVNIQVPITKKDGTKTTTNLQVHRAIADQVKQVLQKAQDAGFKVYEVGGYRETNISNTTKLSQHAYGLAVDINVNENYCVYPDGTIDAGSFWDPSRSEYSIPSNGVLVREFKAIGWGWGGDWHSKKDYMHFSYTGG